MRNFSFRIFITASLLMGFGFLLSYMIGFAVEDSEPNVNLFWEILSKAIYIFSFPIVELFWLFGLPHSESALLSGCVSNCFLNGFLIERLFYFRKKKRKQPPVPTVLSLPEQL